MALIQEIREKIKRRQYEFSKHAVDQSINRDISVADMEDAVAGQGCATYVPQLLMSWMLQLHLFEPRDFNFDYKVIVTNKRESAKSVVLFHNGRGSQEAIFGDAKTDADLSVIPTKRLAGNQIYTLCAMMAHNLCRELQMLASPCHPRSLPKRPAAWTFEKLDTLRHRVIQRAGRLIRPKGELTLTMSANDAVRQDLSHFLDVVQKAA